MSAAHRILFRAGRAGACAVCDSRQLLWARPCFSEPPSASFPPDRPERSQPARSKLSCGLSPLPHTHTSVVFLTPLFKRKPALFLGTCKRLLPKETQRSHLCCRPPSAGTTSRCGLKSGRPAARQDLSSPPAPSLWLFWTGK